LLFQMRDTGTGTVAPPLIIYQTSRTNFDQHQRQRKERSRLHLDLDMAYLLTPET